MTASTGKRFRYALQPLLDWRNWQLTSLKSEMAAASRVLQDCEAALAEVDAARALTLQTMGDMRAGRAALDVHTEVRLRHYMERLAVERDMRQQSHDRAARLHEEAQRNIRRALQASEGLHRHRDRLLRVHGAAADRSATVEADEAWLMAHAPREQVDGEHD